MFFANSTLWVAHNKHATSGDGTYVWWNVVVATCSKQHVAMVLPQNFSPSPNMAIWWPFAHHWYLYCCSLLSIWWGYTLSQVRPWCVTFLRLNKHPLLWLARNTWLWLGTVPFVWKRWPYLSSGVSATRDTTCHVDQVPTGTRTCGHAHWNLQMAVNW